MKIADGYIYIRYHPSYNDACKLGKTRNISKRDAQYATNEIYRGYYISIYKVKFEEMSCIECILQYNFTQYNIRHDAGTEFFQKNIIDLIEPYLQQKSITYKKLSDEEIRNLPKYNNNNRISDAKIELLLQKIKSSYNWLERPYQYNIIKYAKEILEKKCKIYIELPTGGGKSYIVYNIFEYLKSKLIIIISPRKIVNTQNISDKYLQILTNKYIVFNYSIDKNINSFLSSTNNKIIICCTQSITKLYHYIKDITNMTIWFDEAHWSVENMINNEENKHITEFLLLNNININYRIFTSASPNKMKVESNKKIFGKLYSSIKVGQLIRLKWLAPIKSYIYSENKKNINSINYIIKDFVELNKCWGFSFHNTQQNAFNLFYKHYNLYNNQDTKVKPFLLVGDDFTDLEYEIELDYDYRNITAYESTEYSIGYVVDKFSMGYDFNNLDFIYFSDPKSSYQDIIQSIGRGIRPDGLGKDGSNKDKILTISLPVYIDNDDNKYEKIIHVLQYLHYDVEIPFEEIEFKSRYCKSTKNNLNSIDYNGTQDIKSILLNLLEYQNKLISQGTSYIKAIKIIAKEKITTKADYYKLCAVNNRLSKEPEIIYKGSFTNWIDYLSIERTYYDLEACKNKINDYWLLYPELKNELDLSLIINNLCNIDKLFPPHDLWIDYYNVNNLQSIIKPSAKKKLNSLL
jgi:superfamily II DNA or RNA helicase